MSRREMHSFRWDGTRWTPSDTVDPVSSPPRTIRIATLNILADCFPWFVERAIRSDERHAWLCDGIIRLDPTILALNEVTATALERLQQCPYIRDNYFIIDAIHDHADDFDEMRFPHACVILSKLPLLEAFAISCSGRKREAIVGRVQLGATPESCVHICATHTTPYKTQKNVQLRAQQIRDIVQTLEPLGLPFVIMGDLNLYHRSEDAVVLDNHLIDGWAQTHFSRVQPFNDQDQGYTFDAIKNTLIPYYIPGNRRQMRLDRILFSPGFPAVAIAPCTIWANEPIQPDNYLFPSDHFGLSIDLVAADQQEGMPLGKADPSATELLLRNSQSDSDDDDEGRLGIVKRTKAVAAHLFWLGAVTLGLK